MGKFYLISGANQGIGRAIAEDLAQKGHRVFATAPTESGRQSLLGLSENIIPLLLDLRSKEHIEELRISVAQHTDHLDGLINNAGIAMGGPVELLDVDAVRNLFEINVFGHIQMTQAFLPLLRKSKQARIVFTGSAAGIFVRPLLGGYAASKFALTAFCDALRVELRPQKIRVSLIQPGRIKTPIWSTPPDKNIQNHPDAEPYRVAIEKLQQEAEENALASPPVSLVTKAMNHALFSNYPKAQYLVGFDAHIAYWFGILPSFIVDRLLIRLFF
ncbi:MAG: SDR family oxidoreductase [Myxococcota bacterium]|nr:SDR family oxidoreductase [Myxococcota bacterium]